MHKPIRIGEVYTELIQFLKADVEKFAEASGDHNPLHTNPEYCSETRFGRPIVHGALLFSQFSRVFGTIWPGKGSVYVSQTVKFIVPVFVGDSVNLEIKCVEVDKEKKKATFECSLIGANNSLACKGTAVLWLPEFDL